MGAVHAQIDRVYDILDKYWPLPVEIPEGLTEVLVERGMTPERVEEHWTRSGCRRELRRDHKLRFIALVDSDLRGIEAEASRENDPHA